MNIVIIGAGLAGLTAALALKSSVPDKARLILLEKSATPGGLLSGTSFQGFHPDNGAFLFGRKSKIIRILPDLFHEIPDYSIKVWKQGHYYNFPFSLYDVVLKQSAAGLFSTAIDYCVSTLKCYLGRKPANLREWLCYRMTARLLERSGLSGYFAKIQGLIPESVSPLLGDFRFSSLHRITRPWNMIHILLTNVLRIKKKAAVPAFYPHDTNGVSGISGILAEKCQKAGIIIRTSTTVKVLRYTKNGKILIHGEEDNGKTTMYQASHVISTMPITECVHCFGGQVSGKVLEAAGKLRFLDMLVVFLLVRTNYILHRNLTLYSFDSRHHWKRLSSRPAGTGKFLVTIEMTYDPETGVPGKNIVNNAIESLTNELHLFSPDNIEYMDQTIVDHAYPVYCTGFEKNVQKIKDELEKPNFVFAGRQGEFMYINTTLTIDSAYRAVRKLLQAV